MAAGEAELGITAYAGPPRPGFDAVVKHRYTDFIVNEILADGTVVTLTSTGPDAAAAVDAAARAARAAADAAAVAAAAGGETVCDGGGDDGDLDARQRQLAALVGEAAAADAAAWLRSAAAPDAAASPPAPLSLPAPADKPARGAVHAWFRGAAAAARVVGGRVDTVTENDGRITASLRPGAGGGGGGRGRGRGASGRGRGRDGGGALKRRRGDDGGGGGRPWCDRAADAPGGRAAPYLHFTLRKANWDSAAALAALARVAGLPPSSLAVAGTKDKRGVTTQRVSAWGAAAAAVAAGAAKLADVAVGDFGYGPTQLRLGDAGGNRFVVVLRGLAATDAGEVEAAVAGLASHGFLNYYGRQRFGTSRSAGRTHAVGAALSRGDLPAAARLVLAPRRGGGGDDAVRQAWLDGRADARATLGGLLRGAVAERALMSGLARAPSDLAAAFARVPRNLRSMYTHALQSWLWNVGASARAEGVGTDDGGDDDTRRHPLSAVVEGDVVLATDDDEGGGDDAADAGSDGDAPPGGDDADAPRTAPRVRHATAADAAAVPPSRLVLPLIAPGMLHPTHAVADAVRSAAAEVGVDAGTGGPADPAARRPPRAVGGACNAAGGYRRLLVVPTNVGLRWVAHDGADDDVLDGGGGATPAARAWAAGDPPPPHLAAVVSFDLPKSAYATMALRELMRRPTVGGDEGGGQGA